MKSPSPWYETVVLPFLLGAARRAYGSAIREAFADAGFDDMPRRGAFILGSIARNGAAQHNFAGGMGVSKQVASQLVDTLVARGYVERTADPDDRRRMIVTLTPRGAEAAAASRKAVARVDKALEKRISEQDVRSLRRALGALVEIGKAMSPRGGDGEDD